jgi:F420-dependent oxidoreductase-like protein
MQMPGRSPANTAMTAMTLDQLSGGRMLLGLGLSGPQVAEGWHGVAYGKPLSKTREYVEIVRKIFAREEPLVHDGKNYQIPSQGDDATGLGKPLKSILHGRADIPIYLASIGPQNVALTAEIADGWLPIFFSPTAYASVYQPLIEEGFARAGAAKTIAQFDIAPTIYVIIEDNLEMAWNQLKPMLALYIGGMGAKGKNFYNDLAKRLGFGQEAETIQDLYLDGKRAEAVAAVPDELVDSIALCGPKDRIKDRLQQWKDSPVTTLNVATFDIEAIRTMAELVL